MENKYGKYENHEDRRKNNSADKYINRLVQIISILAFMFLMVRTYMRNVYDTGSNVAKKMEKHLYEEYGEEFDVYLLRPIDDGYTAFIQKVSEAGTPKQNDAYYLAGVTMDTTPSKWLGYNKHGLIYDNQWRVVLNEKLNSIVGKEVEKLFGKNYLVVLKMNTTMKTLRNEQELLRNRKTISLTEEEVLELFKRNEIKVEGDIYVFGRVESDEDREKYRKQIYDFVQYLKREKIFDYASLDIKIYDERIFFLKESQKKLSKINFDNFSYDEGNYVMAKALDTYNDRFSKITEKEFQYWLNSINKNKGLTGITGLYFLSNVTGKTYIKNFSMKHVVNDFFDGIKEYNKLEDVRFKGRDF